MMARAARRSHLRVVSDTGSQLPLVERLAMLLAEVIDEPLLTLPGSATDSVTELNLRDFKPELSEAIAALLDETGF